jgi:NADH dehydrogenase
MGVEIHLNTLAVDMDHHSITVKGPDGVQTIPCRSRIWAAGVQAFPLAKLLAEKIGAEVERAGRVPVNPDCSLPGHPEVFAIGDMVSLNKLPGVAQPALQEGRYVGKVIRKRLAGETKIRPFKYFNKGSMATIGYRAAVADAFGLKVTGLLAYVMWGFIHVLYLIGWGNRIGTIYTWFRLHLVPSPGVQQEPRPPRHHLRDGDRRDRRGPHRVGPPGAHPAPAEPAGRCADHTDDAAAHHLPPGTNRLG